MANSVNQSLANQNKLEIRFGVQASASPSVSPSAFPCIQNNDPCDPQSCSYDPNLCASPSPLVGELYFQVRFGGIDTRPANDSNQNVRVRIVEAANPANASQVTASLAVDDNGIYSGFVPLPASLQNRIVDLYLKGPKHRQLRFAQIDSGISQVFDLTARPLEPGDLPNPSGGQDGQVDSGDLGLVEQRLGSTSGADLGVADVDLNNVINAGDIHYVHDTLSTKQDE